MSPETTSDGTIIGAIGGTNAMTCASVLSGVRPKSSASSESQ